MRIANEVRVGAVVVAALLLLFSGYFFLRGIDFGADLYYVRVAGAASIAPGNDVRLQGIKVGSVKEVTLDPGTQQPLVTLAVRRSTPPFRLLKKYAYTVQSSALIGENFMDIRGPFDPNAPVYTANKPDEIIPGRASLGLAAITDVSTKLAGDFSKTMMKVNTTLDRINKGVLSYDNQIKLARTLDNVTKLSRDASQAFGPQGVRFGFGDPRAQRSLNETLANTALASRQATVAAGNLGRLTSQAGATIATAQGALGDARSLIAENRSQLRGLLVTFNQTAKNVSGLTETLAFLTRDTGLKEDTQIILGSLRRTSENVEAASSSFRNLAGDKATQGSLRATIAALRTSTEALRDTATSIKGLATDTTLQDQLKSTLSTISATAGTLQTTTENLRVTTEGFKNIVGDPQVQADLKIIPAELRRTLEATSATAERINALLGGRRNRNGNSKTGDESNSSAAPSRTRYTPGGLDFTFRRSVNGNVGKRNFGDVNFNTELFGAPLRAGISGIGEGDDLTLQTGRFLGRRGALRYGIYRSKLGAGLDFQRGRLSLEGNLYDPNRRSYNIYGGVSITPKVDVLLGRENFGGRGTNSIAVRVRP